MGIAVPAVMLSTLQTQATSQATQLMNDSTVQKLLDRLEIIDVVNQVGITADSRDWNACRNCFLEQVDIDYTSLNGGQSSIIAADDLIKNWRKQLNGLKATQHMITNHAVTLNGDTASCISLFQAQHLFPNNVGFPLWTLGGVYHHQLVRTNGGWKVHRMKMTATWANGNQQIMTLAANLGQSE